MTATPLNLFQRLVRSWEAVHPYNAAQVLRLSGYADPHSVNHAWHQAMASLGLGRVQTDGQWFSHHILNGEAGHFPVRMLANASATPSPSPSLQTGAIDAECTLEHHLTGELNRPFDDLNEPPFRPFLIQSDGVFYFGLVYQHWVADSISIRMLLREWCARMYDDRLADSRRQNGTASYWDLYGPRRGQTDIGQNLLALVRNYIRFRTVQKVTMTGVGDYPVRVMLRDLPEPIGQTLRQAARAQNVKVGDVFQAALAQACHRHIPLQRRPGRRDLAIGNIVDLRPHAGRDLSNVFGFYLGFSHVVCTPADFSDFSRLLRSIAAQNRARRRDGLAQSSLAWMLAATIAHRFRSPEKLYRFYRKEIPLAAGLSNVNVEDRWAQRLHPWPLQSYLRISPTGPMAPLVLSATTLGSRMQLAFTYRTSLLSEEDAGALAQTVIERVGAVAGGNVPIDFR